MSVASGCACDRIRRFHRERVPIWDFTTSGLKEVYSQVSYYYVVHLIVSSLIFVAIFVAVFISFLCVN